MNYMHEICLSNSPEFNHINEQFKLVKLLHEETIRYTSIVEEDEEDKVFQSLKKAKNIMAEIGSASNQTEKYVKELLH